MDKKIINKRESELSSIECERHSLSGLCLYPEILPEIDLWVKEIDYYNDCHQTIFLVLKQIILNGEKPDKVLVAQKIANLGIKFKDEINIFDYIENLFYATITKEATIEAFKELIKLRIRRELYGTCKKIAEFIKKNGEETINNIIVGCDKIYGEKVNVYLEDEPKEIMGPMEGVIEEIGNNPPKEQNYPLGPFPTINRIYGSLVKRGAINIVAARTGIGKTAFGFFYLAHIAQKYNLPILHLDFGEMSVLELQMRAVCAFSKGKVPYAMLEKGIWRNNPETFKLVREVWPKVKGLQIYYYDIGNMRPDEIISLIKRFSYKHIPKNIREDPNALGFLVHFDYLKPFQFDPRLQEYQEMGFFIQKIKYLIKDIAPCNFWASLQANRSGVTNNRLSTQVDDSDAIFSLSDRLIGASTHAWILRHKLTDELTNETTRFGNLKFKCMKHRHLGIDYQDAINLVQVKKGIYARNYINLQHDSFYFEDRGDLNEMVEELKEEHDLQDSTIVDEEANGM